MRGYQIILLILIIAVFVFAVFFIFVFSHIIDFRKSMNKRLRAMDILLSEKAANLLSLFDALKADGIQLGDDDIENCKRLRELYFDKPTAKTVSENKATIDAVRKRITYLALANESILYHPAYKECKNNLDDLDVGFRRCVVLYNSDLLAFNYWIDIPGTRLFVFLFRIEKAEMIK